MTIGAAKFRTNYPGPAITERRAAFSLRDTILRGKVYGFKHLIYSPFAAECEVAAGV